MTLGRLTLIYQVISTGDFALGAGWRGDAFSVSDGPKERPAGQVNGEQLPDGRHLPYSDYCAPNEKRQVYAADKYTNLKIITQTDVRS